MSRSKCKSWVLTSSMWIAAGSVVQTIAAAKAAALPAQVTAPDPDKASSASGQPVLQLHEVVVTAMKRRSTAQGTAAALTVVSASDLAKQQAVGVSDLNALLPNTQIYAIQNNVQFAIRGIGSTFLDPRADPAVAVSINGLFLDRALPSSFALLDVARIEVLRGPQGTLYGRNAVAGAVNIITNRPVDRFEGYVTATGGNLGTNNFSGVVNLPLGDTLAVRLAYERDRSRGYVENYYDDVNADSGRISALWTPLERLHVYAEWDYSHQGGHGSAQQDYPCPGTQPYSVNIPASCSYPAGIPYNVPLDGHVNAKTNAYQVHVDYDAGFATLTSITGYVITYNNNRQTNGAIFANPNPALAGDTLISTSKDFTEELRLTGGSASHAGGLAWVVGSFIFNSTGNYHFIVPSIGGGNIYPELPQKSQAGFAQLTYGITDRFRVTGGARYTHDFKGLSYPWGPPTSEAENHWNYKAGVEYDFTNQNLLYANVSSGYVSGGPNGGHPTASLPPNYGQTTFRAETLTAYEAGSKNRFLDGRVQLNGDLYYYDFKDYQLFLPGLLVGSPGPVSVIQNVPHVKTYGLELSAAALASPNDEFHATLDLAHGEFGQANLVTFGGAPPAFVGVPYPVTSGTRLLNLPEWQGTLGYDHTFRLASGSSLVFSVASKLSGNYLVTVTEGGTPIPADVQPAYTRTDLSLAYHFAGDRIVVRGWVKNVENSYVNLYGEGAGYYLYSDLPPRTYGVTGTVTF